jgi:hypothetical protein
MKTNGSHIIIPPPPACKKSANKFVMPYRAPVSLPTL